MIHLDLDSHDADVLRETLMSDVSELGHEIARTDSLDFRNRLKEKREVLERLIGYLEAH